MKEKTFRDFMILALVLGLIIFSFLIIRPFIIAILASMILAYLFSPLYNWLNKILKKPNLSAGIISIGLILLLIIPLWFFMPMLLRQTFDFYSSMQGVDLISPIKKILPMFFNSPEITRDLTASLQQQMTKASTSFINIFGKVIENMAMIFMSLFVVIFIFFFTLRDADKIVSRIKELSLLKPEGEKRFLLKFSGITKTIIYGFFVIGLVQGIVVGIGLFIFHAPQPMFLTIIAILAGILPIIGPVIVYLPVGVLMISQGSTFNGWGLIIFGVLATTWIDPVLRSLMLKKAANVSTAVALVGMLGGYMVFGLIGLIAGPLILSYLILLIEFYRENKFSELFERK